MSTTLMPLRTAAVALQALASDGMKTAAIASADAPPSSNVRTLRSLLPLANSVGPDLRLPEVVLHHRR